MKIERLRSGSSSDRDAMSARHYQLLNVIHFCEDVLTCRRQLQLKYFGESFNPDDCQKMCDNCARNKECLELLDVTFSAKKLVELVKDITPSQSLKYVIDVFRGSNSRKVIENNHHLLSGFASGKSMRIEDATKMAITMICQQYLLDEFESRGQFCVSKVKLGPFANQLLSNGTSAKLSIPRITEAPKISQHLSDELYLIEYIVGRRIVKKGRVEYLVKWLGYPHNENTWEREDKLVKECPEVVNEFESRTKPITNKKSRKKQKIT